MRLLQFQFLVSNLLNNRKGLIFTVIFLLYCVHINNDIKGSVLVPGIKLRSSNGAIVLQEGERHCSPSHTDAIKGGVCTLQKCHIVFRQIAERSFHFGESSQMNASRGRNISAEHKTKSEMRYKKRKCTTA